MKPLRYVLGGAISAGAVGVGASIVVRSVLRPKASKAFKDYGAPQAHGLPAQKVELPDGIHGWWVPNEDAEVAVLLVHGRSRAAGWMYPIAKQLWPRTGLMAIDLPGHGQSRSSYVSYGFAESKCVRDAIDFLAATQSKPIVIVGVSMGGASAIIAQAKYPSERVIGIVTIGTYTDIESVFKRVSDNANLPWTVTKPLFRIAGNVGGFDLEHNRPIDCVRELSVPYLAVQGDSDELVPVESAERLADACRSEDKAFAYYRGLHDVPDHPEMFEYVDAFIRAREADARAIHAPSDGSLGH